MNRRLICKLGEAVISPDSGVILRLDQVYVSLYKRSSGWSMDEGWSETQKEQYWADWGGNRDFRKCPPMVFIVRAANRPYDRVLLSNDRLLIECFCGFWCPKTYELFRRGSATISSVLPPGTLVPVRIL